MYNRGISKLLKGKEASASLYHMIRILRLVRRLGDLAYINVNECYEYSRL